MNIPRFNAEASLGPAGIYAGKGIHSIHRGEQVLARIIPSQSMQFRFNPFPEMRCCGYSSLLGRIICVSRRASPLENCRCERTPFGPQILCSEPVFEAGT